MLTRHDLREIFKINADRTSWGWRQMLYGIHLRFCVVTQANKFRFRSRDPRITSRDTYLQKNLVSIYLGFDLASYWLPKSYDVIPECIGYITSHVIFLCWDSTLRRKIRLPYVISRYIASKYSWVNIAK